MDKEFIIKEIKKQLENGTDYNDVKLDAYNIEEQDQEGGEGQGEEYFVVYKVTKDDNTIYVKADGYYTSYEGYNFEFPDVYEVVESEKMIKYWKAIK
jgi:hypothetical protein